MRPVESGNQPISGIWGARRESAGGLCPRIPRGIATAKKSKAELIGKSLPDMTEAFEQFAAGLKSRAEDAS
ncbi:MAG: hypothetical protein MJE77_28510 [Proteobacteria bacterium]|nr:hypothetical protein [Pseudomonadota bacterium]